MSFLDLPKDLLNIVHSYLAVYDEKQHMVIMKDIRMVPKFRSVKNMEDDTYIVEGDIRAFLSVLKFYSSRRQKFMKEKHINNIFS